MRKLLFILLAVLLMPCCMYQPKNGVRPLLEEAERMLHTCPDTAYFLLREIGVTMDWETEADSAYHALLLMEARTKNGMKLADDSAIIKLETYYAKQRDRLASLRLLRLRAVMWRDDG